MCFSARDMLQFWTVVTSVLNEKCWKRDSNENSQWMDKCFLRLKWLSSSSLWLTMTRTQSNNVEFTNGNQMPHACSLCLRSNYQPDRLPHISRQTKMCQHRRMSRLTDDIETITLKNCYFFVTRSECDKWNAIFAETGRTAVQHHFKVLLSFPWKSWIFISHFFCFCYYFFIYLQVKPVDCERVLNVIAKNNTQSRVLQIFVRARAVVSFE